IVFSPKSFMISRVRVEGYALPQYCPPSSAAPACFLQSGLSAAALSSPQSQELLSAAQVAASFSALKGPSGKMHEYWRSLLFAGFSSAVRYSCPLMGFQAGLSVSETFTRGFVFDVTSARPV